MAKEEGFILQEGDELLTLEQVGGGILCAGRG